MNSLARIVATFAYTGFFPFAPATFATAVFLALYWLVPGGEWLARAPVVALTVLLSVPAAERVERTHGKDPHCVVIDEVVGMQLILLGAQPSWAGVAAAFVLFRAFDVGKPFPIHRLQSLPGGWGIVADDVMAGMYTRAILMATGLFTGVFGRF
jgi:phosphatidylglycerophosphatase A